MLRWGLEYFGHGLCLATSFGPQSIVLMHVISRLQPSTTVFYLDTDLLFPETYRLRDELTERLDLRFTRVTSELTVEEQAARHGGSLWSRDPDLCCRLRKVLPLRRFLADKRAWITGVRAEHTPARAGADGTGQWHFQAGGDCDHPADTRAFEGRRLRCGNSRLYRVTLDHR